MVKEWKKRELYEKYAGVCLSEKEYAFLEEKGIIPKNLNEFFSGILIYETLHKLNFWGETVEKIVGSGVKLFLENWTSTDKFGSEHTAMFFFDDYVVILAEPKLNLGKLNCVEFDRAPDVLPVAIPISNIQCYNSEIYGSYTHCHSFKFKNGASFRSKNFVVVGNNKPQNQNVAHHVNKELLGNFSMSQSGIEAAQNSITARIETLMNNCSRDFEQRQNAISNLFTDYSVMGELQPVVYLSKEDFVEKMGEKVSFISKDNFPHVISALNSFNEYQIKSRDELQSYITERGKKVNACESASLFEKMKIKKELKELDERIDKVSNSADKKNHYETAYKEILKIADFKDAKASTGEHFSIPDEYVPLAKEIYLLCKSRNVEKIETEDEKMIFSLLCKKQNVPEEYQTEEFFSCGIMATQKETQDNNYQELNKSKIHKAMLHNDAKDKADICGPIKYTKKAMEEQAQAREMAKATQLLGELSELHTQVKAVKSDAAILGGLASGIAGPAAGIATYAQVEIDNARAEAEAAETRAKGRENLENARILESGYQSVARSLGGSVARIYDKLYDSSNVEKYFSYLNCKVNSYVVEKDGMMAIDVSVDFVKKAELHGLPIIIDGSFCVDIKEADKKVGDAYVCAPGFDELDLNKVGFNAQNKYTTIGIPTALTFDSEKEYTFEIKPVNIWMIEK